MLFRSLAKISTESESLEFGSSSLSVLALRRSERNLLAELSTDNDVVFSDSCCADGDGVNDWNPTFDIEGNGVEGIVVDFQLRRV